MDWVIYLMKTWQFVSMLVYMKRILLDENLMKTNFYVFNLAYDSYSAVVHFD